MKLGCQMEVCGFKEIVLFRSLKFTRSASKGDGRQYWDKSVYHDGQWWRVGFVSDHWIMNKIKALAKRKDIHTWVSETTLNMVRR